MATETNIDSLSKLRKADNEGVVRRVDGYRVKYDQIRIQPGFNARGAFMSPEEYWNLPDVVSYIESIALSFASDIHVPPITITIIDGEPVLSDGEHRYRGFGLALKKYGIKSKSDPKALGLKDDYMDVVEDKESRGGERSLSLLDLNSGRNFSPISTAVLYQRAVDDGYKVEYIAKRNNKSVPHVYKYLTAVNKWGDELLGRVQRGELSFTAAQAIYEESRRKNKPEQEDTQVPPTLSGSEGDADDQIQLTGTDLDQQGGDTTDAGGKTSPKEPTKAKAKGISKQISDSIVNLIFGCEPEVKGDSYTLTLTKEQYDSIKELQKQVEKDIKNI